MFTIGGRAHTIDETLEVAKQGYPFAEISLNHSEEVEAHIPQLLDIQDQFGIDYLAHFPNEGNPADLDALRKRFLPKIKQLAAMCPRLNIRKATLHFWMDDRWDWATEEIIAGKLEMLSGLVDYARQFDVTLCLENLSGGHECFSKCFNEIPDLRMTMDIGHGQLLNDKNTAFGFMEHLFENIAHIHVHDNHGGDNVTDDLHLPLGEGIIDYPRILGILKTKGYNSTMTMEVAPREMEKTKSVIQKYML